MTSRYEARLLSDGDIAQWSELVAAAPAGSVYHSSEYQCELSKATGGRSRILGAFKGESLVGGLPLYEESSPAGPLISPRLLLYYNGIVLRPLESRYPSKIASETVQVTDALARWMEREGYAQIVLKSSPQVRDVRAFISRGWTAYPTYSYVVDIEDLDRTWDRVEQNLRRLVKRAESAGVTCGEDDDIDSFLALHSATMTRKARASYLDPQRFRRFIERLRELGLGMLYQARLQDGTAVGTALILHGFGPVAHTVSAAAAAEYQSLGVNALLRWKSFQALHDQGYTSVDLTDATLNPVTRFKSQLGGRLVTSFEVAAPVTWRYKAWQSAVGTKRFARGAIGSVVRRLGLR